MTKIAEAWAETMEAGLRTFVVSGEIDTETWEEFRAAIRALALAVHDDCCWLTEEYGEDACTDGKCDIREEINKLGEKAND